MAGPKENRVKVAEKDETGKFHGSPDGALASRMGGVQELSPHALLFPTLPPVKKFSKYTRFDAQSLYDAMICNMDSIGKYMLEITLHQQRTPQLLKEMKLMQTQEDHSNPIQTLNIDSLKVDLAVIQNTCFEKEDSNSETASSKSVKECSLNSETKDVHAIKYKMSKAKERSMTYF
ncbi:hypothetical protein Tco_1195176 [Tanacetum coccineum]